MSYNHYFQLVALSDLDKIKDKTISELVELYGADDHVCFSDLYPHKNIFEFGRLNWNDLDERIMAKGTPLFTTDAQEYFSTYNPYVVNRDGVLEAIDFYSRKIETYFLNLLEDEVEVDENWGKRHPKLARICTAINVWLLTHNFRCLLPNPVTKISHKDKCVRAVMDKLNLISPYYRALRFSDMVDGQELEQRFEEVKQQPVMVVDTNLDEPFKMTNIWRYEYEVFTLCSILKHVDWENYTLIFLGW